MQALMEERGESYCGDDKSKAEGEAEEGDTKEKRDDWGASEMEQVKLFIWISAIREESSNLVI